MGILDLLGKQFIDVIEWNEPQDGILAWRFPVTDQEIQNGASLTVRDSQLALFVNEGKIADKFSPGRYTLTTQTLPILTSIKNWDKLFQSPFKSDIYFFSTREQIDQRWGTSVPVVVRDKELGAVRLRAHGTFTYKIVDPQLFFTKISGTRNEYKTEEINGQLQSLILTGIANFFGNAGVAFLDMAANQEKFSAAMQESLVSAFTAYGLGLGKFLVQSISLPEELQAHLDKRISMTIVGDLNRYTQFQTADSIPLAAENPSGAAGAGIGLGAGIAMGQSMQQALQQNTRPGSDAPVNEDPVSAIEKLHGLFTRGVISQADFETKKAELLAKIR